MSEDTDSDIDAFLLADEVKRDTRRSELAAAMSSRITFTDRPVCPECLKFIPPALWDTHRAGHHANRVGLAEEAASPPPERVYDPEVDCTACICGYGLHNRACCARRRGI